MMDNEIMCPWCNKKTIPKMSLVKKQNGSVRERRCAECDNVLAAYLEEEGDFMGNIRKFQN